MKPVDKIPDELLTEFTLGNRVPVVYQYNDATAPEVQQSINEKFTVNELQDCVKRVLRGEASYYGYTDPWLYQALEDFPIFNQRVALIGSTYPWYEAVLLTRVPRSIGVIEYSDRELRGINQLYYMKPDEVERFVKTVGPFDAVVSISSYEHDGLGRYGDPLNPNGDLEAMHNLKKIVKPGGLLYLAVPVGRDKIFFNLHRVYGKFRLPLLLKEWEVVEMYGAQPSFLEIDNPGDYQPVFVLRNS